MTKSLWPWLSAAAAIAIPALAHADGAANHVRDVRIHADGAGATDIEVVGSGSPVYQARFDAAKKRLVVDISNSDVVGAPEAITGTHGLAGGVLTSTFPTVTGGTMTRVMINFARDATYRIRPDGSTLHVLLYGTSLGASAASTLPDFDKTSAKNDVAVAAELRADAISATHALIDRIKAEVPIWKHQQFTDGTEECIGCT